MTRGTRAARGAAARALGTLVVWTLVGCAGGVRLPRIGSHFMPPVVPYASDSLTLGGRVWHRLREPAYDLYVQSPRILPLVDGHLRATTQEFTRHFGGAPRVAVLVFDPPADPTHDFDFTPFQAAGTQVLVFVRARKPPADDPLGIDDGLLRTRLAELFLASYADSVVGRTIGLRDATSGQRAVDRLPHWFAEAVVSRVARPDAVEPGLAYLRANRLHLVPLKRLFGVARLGGPPWSELATAHAAALPTVRAFVPSAPPPALLAAESTVFGEFLVDRYGPTFLQAVADDLLLGVPSEQVLVTLDGGADDGAMLERRWVEWLARR